MTERVALYLQDAHPIREGMEHARYAEACGFEAVWQAESRLVREATVPMAAFASVTERIKVGSGVADCWSRNPARLAATFATLDDLAPGRILLGLGAWWDPLARKVGIDRAHPLTVMREVVGAVRALLRNETVTVDGTYVHLDGVELDYVYQERRAKDVPIYIGATGMQMMELTGEIADGVVLNYLVSPDYNARAMEHLATGAARAGRPVDDIDRPQLVVCSVHEDQATALDMARLMVTQYLGQQPHIMKASGVPAVAARRRRGGADVAGDARAGGGRVQAGAGRDRRDADGVRHAGPGEGQGRRLRARRLHVSHPLPARRRAGDDRRLRRIASRLTRHRGVRPCTAERHAAPPEALPKRSE